MKKHTQKLRLNRETVRHFEAALSQVQGGGPFNDSTGGGDPGGSHTSCILTTPLGSCGC